MSIYEKSVRLLLKDFVDAENIVKGQIFSKDQVMSWFRTKYPRIKTGTITAHLLRMSVNSPTRIHYSVYPNGEDDLLYKVDGSHFRLYEPETDPAPNAAAPATVSADLMASRRERALWLPGVGSKMGETRGFICRIDCRNTVAIQFGNAPPSGIQ